MATVFTTVIATVAATVFAMVAAKVLAEAFTTVAAKVLAMIFTTVIARVGKPTNENEHNEQIQNIRIYTRSIKSELYMFNPAIEANLFP